MASYKDSDDHIQPGQSLMASQGCTPSANSIQGQKPDWLVSMWRAVLSGACGSMGGLPERRDVNETCNESTLAFSIFVHSSSLPVRSACGHF